MPASTDIGETTIPKKKDAGTYYVYYKILKDGGSTYTEDGLWTEVGVGGVTIAKREIKAEDFTVTFADGLTYDESDQDLVTDFAWTNSITRGTVEYKVNETDPASVTAVANPTGKNAGDYTVQVVITGDANHYDYMSAIDLGQVNIAKASIDIVQTPTGFTNLVYDATDQQLLNQGLKFKFNGADALSKVTIEYSVDGSPAGSSYKDPKGKDAGEYTVTYEVHPKDLDNFNDDLEGGTITVKIEKAEWTVALPGLTPDWEYDAVEKALLDGPVVATGYGSDAGVVSYYINEGDAIEFDAVKAKDVDEYEISYSVAEAANYKAIDKTSIGTVTVSKHGIDVAAQSVSVNWTGTPVEAGELIRVDPTDIPAAETLTPEEIAAALAGFVDGEFKENDGTNITVVEPIPSDAGNYTFVLETKENQNYVVNDFVPNGTLTIIKIDAVAADVTAATLEYNGAEQELVEVDETPMEGVDKMLYYLDETGEGVIPVGDARWSEDIPVGKDAGDYTVFYMAKGDKNHKDVEPAQVDVTIAQKALDITMFTFSDDDMTEVYTGADLTPTFEAFDAVFGTTDENALAETDYTVAKTNSAGDDAETMVNVDVYTFTFTAEADGNYSGTVSIDFEITPKDLADDMFTLSEDVTYNGKAQQPTIDAVDGDPNALAETDFTIEVKDSEGNIVDIDNLVDADTYTFNFIATADGNYQGAASADWTIEKKALEDSFFTLAPEDLEFNGADQYPSVTVTAEDLNDEDNNIITDADFVETQIEYNGEVVTELINAGEYTFTYEATADGNYEGTATATISIAKIDANIYEPEKIDLTYNNTDQAPVTEGTTDAIAGAAPEDFDGKVEYQIVQGEEVLVDWTDDYADVVIKNAGDYTVNYKITASEVNYNNPLVEGSIEVSILKAEISYILGNVTKDWDGEPFTKEQIDGLFAINNGELFGSDKYDRPFDFEVPEDYKDAGTYTFTQPTVVFKEGYPENYDVKVTGTAELVINKVDIEDTDFTAPEAIADLVYINGTAQDLVTEGEVTTTYLWDGDEEGTPIGTIVFATEEDGEYSEDVPQGTDAGDYEIWWKVVGDKNHNDTDPVKIENTIAPNAIDFTLKFEDATETYTGEDFMPADVVAYDGETALEADKDYTLEITDDATELVNAGTYVFTYTGIGNYEGSTAEVTITIEPKALENKMITLSKTETEFNNEDQKPTYELKYNDMVLVEDVDFTVVADEEMIKGGEYQFTFTGIGNYCDNAEATFTIKKRVVIAQAENVEKPYNGLYGLNVEGGQVEVPITWGSLVPGDENVPVPGEGAITVEPYKKDIGKYAIIVDGSKFESDNYEVIKGDREAWLTITAVDLKVKWASGAKASKVYGEADPDLAEFLAIEGAVSAEVEDVRANTVITRSEGETVGSYDISLAAKAGAAVFGNYNVTFEGAEGVFTINKAPLTVTLAPQTATYTGEKADLGEIPSDQLVVSGLISNEDLGIDDFKDVISNIEVNIPDDAITVGDYEITLAGVAADNYECEFLPATLTIEPLEITTATLEAQKVQQGKKLDLTAFTAEGIPAVDADKFYVAAPGLADEDGTVTGDAGVYADGLVLAVDAAVADNYVLGEFTAELEIIAAETLILDDTQDIATTAKDGVNVTFSSRNVLQDNWNVVCLPFDVTVKQVSEAFGYAAVDLLNPEPSDGNMHFIVTTTGTITAGTPFIVKPTSDEDLGAVSNFDQITFYDVNVKAFSANPTPVADNGGNKFCGTFMAQTTFYGDKFWYMSKGMWKQASNYTEAKPVKLAAYRAYIELASADARIFVEEPDGSITAIDAINFNGNAVDADGWYTVNGMKLNAAPTQKGTYVKDGKKVIVK